MSFINKTCTLLLIFKEIQKLEIQLKLREYGRSLGFSDVSGFHCAFQAQLGVQLLVPGLVVLHEQMEIRVIRIALWMAFLEVYLLISCLS